MLSSHRRTAIATTAIATATAKLMMSMIVLSLSLLVVILSDDDKGCGAIMLVEGFRPGANANIVCVRGRGRQYTSSRTQQLGMCICVDCKLVTSCKAYHFVETKHEQPHMADQPTFLPREGSPTINVNIRTEPNNKKKSGDSDDEDKDDVARMMWKDQIQQNEQEQVNDVGNGEEEETILESGTEANPDHTDEDAAGPIEYIASTSTTTIEYDVVKCADFVLDQGCWIRNMPDEIKRCNPDFVPT